MSIHLTVLAKAEAKNSLLSYLLKNKLYVRTDRWLFVLVVQPQQGIFWHSFRFNKGKLMRENFSRRGRNTTSEEDTLVGG